MCGRLRGQLGVLLRGPALQVEENAQRARAICECRAICAEWREIRLGSRRRTTIRV